MVSSSLPVMQTAKLSESFMVSRWLVPVCSDLWNKFVGWPAAAASHEKRRLSASQASVDVSSTPQLSPRLGVLNPPLTHAERQPHRCKFLKAVRISADLLSMSSMNGTKLRLIPGTSGCCLFKDEYEYPNTKSSSTYGCATIIFNHPCLREYPLPRSRHHPALWGCASVIVTLIRFGKGRRR